MYVKVHTNGTFAFRFTHFGLSFKRHFFVVFVFADRWVVCKLSLEALTVFINWCPEVKGRLAAHFWMSTHFHRCLRLNLELWVWILQGDARWGYPRCKQVFGVRLKRYTSIDFDWVEKPLVTGLILLSLLEVNTWSVDGSVAFDSLLHFFFSPVAHLRPGWRKLVLLPILEMLVWGSDLVHRLCVTLVMLLLEKVSRWIVYHPI